ncbi:MAG TPA: aspartate dehydrogenase [Candidatus Nitrosopolaris sp.]|nr:aspartate dehydrogenase [Candidatus Nitrosopolaris sp.]
MNVCLIGCGAIGSELAIAIDSGKAGGAALVALFDAVEGAAQKLKLRLRKDDVAIFSNFSELTSSPEFKDANIVIEAASQEAAKTFSKHIVEKKKDLLMMSVGALADKFFLSQLLNVVYTNGNRIYLPSGAIAGIDAIKSVKGLLDSVTLTTTKNPGALAGAPFFDSGPTRLNSIKKRTLVYQGTAADAVDKFPANINVAAVLGLAGIGIQRTKVKIIVDPNTTVNQHQIEATGAFGEMSITVRNVPSPHNPKTSFLAILSAIECLRSICEPGIKVGT